MSCNAFFPRPYELSKARIYIGGTPGGDSDHRSPREPPPPRTHQSQSPRPIHRLHEQPAADFPAAEDGARQRRLSFLPNDRPDSRFGHRQSLSRNFHGPMAGPGIGQDQQGLDMSCGKGEAGLPPKTKSWGTFGPDYYSGSVDAAWVTGSQYWWNYSIMGPNDHRAGSYAANSWLDGNWWWNYYYNVADPRRDFVFMNDEQITQSSSTPMMGDAVTGPWGWAGGFGWGWGGGWWGPTEFDFPPTNLEFGWGGSGYWGMGQFCIPRHGSRPSVLATNYPPNLKLPRGRQPLLRRWTRSTGKARPPLAANLASQLSSPKE